MKNIFLIEPDAVLRRAYKDALDEFTVYEFSTANMSVRALEKIIPEAIILEPALPGHNGFEFLYEMLSYSDTRKIKVMINSFIQEKDIPFGFINRGDFNIYCYLNKASATKNDLLQAIREAFSLS